MMGQTSKSWWMPAKEMTRAQTNSCAKNTNKEILRTSIQLQVIQLSKSSRGIHRGAYSSDLSWWKSIPIIVSQNRVRSQNAIGCLVFVSQSLFLFKSSTTGRFPVKLKDFPSWKPQVFASCNKSIRYNSSHPFLGSPLDLGKMAIWGETVYLIFWHTDILDYSLDNRQRHRSHWGHCQHLAFF